VLGFQSMSTCKYYLPITAQVDGECGLLRRLKLDDPAQYEEVAAHMSRQAERSAGARTPCLFRGLPPCDYRE
jgi:hypothetical protein